MDPRLGNRDPVSTGHLAHDGELTEEPWAADTQRHFRTEAKPPNLPHICPAAGTAWGFPCHPSGLTASQPSAALADPRVQGLEPLPGSGGAWRAPSQQCGRLRYASDQQQPHTCLLTAPLPRGHFLEGSQRPDPGVPCPLGPLLLPLPPAESKAQGRVRAMSGSAAKHNPRRCTGVGAPARHST